MAGYGKSRVLVNVRASIRVLARGVVNRFRRKREGRCVRISCLMQPEQQTPSKYVGVRGCSLGTIDSVAGEGAYRRLHHLPPVDALLLVGRKKGGCAVGQTHPARGLHQYCATRSLPDVLYPRLDDRQCARKACLDPAACKGVQGAFITPGGPSTRVRQGLHFRACPLNTYPNKASVPKRHYFSLRNDGRYSHPKHFQSSGLLTHACFL